MAKIDATSSDYKASTEYWLMVSTMLAGTQAMRDSMYLPRFENETLPNYRLRKSAARFTNIFGDIIDNLAARPFSKELKITNADATMMGYMEDLDGMKNNVHQVGKNWFKGALAKGIEWVFADYTKTNPMTVGADGTPRRKTVYEEKKEGARPYAVRIKPEDVLAAYSAMILGREQFVHVRFRELSVRVVDYEEVAVERIREFNRAPIFAADSVDEIIGYAEPTWVVWEKVEGTGKTVTWKQIDEGTLYIGEIPMTPLIIGERDFGWHVVAALNDAVWLQLEYFEQENGLKNLKTLTAFPMLTASGVSPVTEQYKKDDGSMGIRVVRAPVGPRAVLYAPANDISGTAGEWKFIEPSGASLNFLSKDLVDLAKELRELGRQPLTANSGNLTVVTTAFAAAKGNAAIQEWALTFKDALENVLRHFALWEGVKEPTVEVPLDFSLETGQDSTFKDVQEMRKNGDLSRKTTWAEAQRRKILSDEFDPDEEETLLEDELPGEAEMDDMLAAGGIDPLTGKPLPKKEDEIISPPLELDDAA